MCEHFRHTFGELLYRICQFFKPKTITLDNFNSIQKMYIIDEEGELSTKKIDLSISDNNIKQVKCTYDWNSEKEFEE